MLYLWNSFLGSEITFPPLKAKTTVLYLLWSGHVPHIQTHDQIGKRFVTWFSNLRHSEDMNYKAAHSFSQISHIQITDPIITSF